MTASERPPLFSSSVDGETFRTAMAQLAAPVTVLTCYGPGGRMWGLTVSAVCSLSAAPPTVLVCLNRTARSHDVMVGAELVCLHLLAPGQERIAMRFAAQVDRFRGQNVRRGAVPELTDVQVRITCVPTGSLDGGTHTILLGRVVAVAGSGGGGLVWHQRGPRAVAG